MDPLSVIASIITIAMTTQPGIKILIQAYGAQPELFALSNELTELMVILEEGRQALELCTTSMASNSELMLVLASTHKELSKLHLQLEGWISCLKRKPKIKSMIIGSKLKTFRARLQAQRSQLLAIWSALSVTSLSRVRLDLHDIHVLVDQLTTQNASFETNLRKHSEGMSIITGKLDSLHNKLDSGDNSKSLTPFVAGENRFVPSLAYDANLGSSSTDEYVTRKLIDSCNNPDTSGVAVRTFSYSKRRRCKPECTCVCHGRKTFKSVRFLNALVGALFIGYSAQPVLNARCNVPQCKMHRVSQFEFTYIFPQWFLAQMVSVVMMSMPSGESRSLFRVHRAVKGGADVFSFAKFGQVANLQNLFSSGMGSPNDVHFWSGVTALDFAISFRRLDTIKFLLDAGADPLLRGVTGGCPADKAWTMVLTNALSPEEEEAFRIMFTQTQDFEDRNFTLLHEIVLGLTNRSLIEELEAQTTDVNAQDGIGLTALSMAAKRGDAESVKLLLMYGADPNIPSHSGKDALCYATKQNNRECIILLLNGGAKATNCTVYQQTALHFAALRSRDEHVAERLLCAGADINAADRDGRTPLGFTPLHNNVEFAAWLLKHGANVRCPGPSAAHDPLIQAIIGNRHELLKLFIQHGFDIDVPLPNGQTLLHYIAEWADEKTMALMSQCEISRLMVGKEDNEGKTALDIIRKRGEVSPLMIKCFFMMLESSLTTEIEADDKKSQDS